MNSVIENMYNRRTIRKYTDEAIKEEHLNELYKVIESTQSWANSQCWEIVNVENPELRKQIQATVPTKNPAYLAIVNAPTLMVVCGRKGKSGYIGEEMTSPHGDWYMHDLGLMTQNLCLAAHSLNIGSVVVGWFDQVKTAEIVNCPEGVEVVSVIPMGYINQVAKEPAHKPVADFLHTDTF